MGVFPLPPKASHSELDNLFLIWAETFFLVVWSVCLGSKTRNSNGEWSHHTLYLCIWRQQNFNYSYFIIIISQTHPHLFPKTTIMFIISFFSKGAYSCGTKATRSPWLGSRAGYLRGVLVSVQDWWWTRSQRPCAQGTFASKAEWWGMLHDPLQLPMSLGWMKRWKTGRKWGFRCLFCFVFN